MKITLKDGSSLEFSAPITAAEVAKSISEGLYRNAVCVKINFSLQSVEFIVDIGFKLVDAGLIFI